MVQIKVLSFDSQKRGTSETCFCNARIVKNSIVKSGSIKTSFIKNGVRKSRTTQVSITEVDLVGT